MNTWKGTNNCCSSLFEDGWKATCSSFEQPFLFGELIIYVGLTKGEGEIVRNFFPHTFAELMVPGFISLLLTFGQVYIGRICIPIKAADSMLPCPLRHAEVENMEEHRRRLLWNDRRFLAAVGASVKKCKTVSVFCT
ncbi:hypothetical protein GIB67_025079 [Kingdonia uniflora]|uniref:Uncharacterized protein n=1 Tax=Kingdonia uniflora TaxID=39325 RepID=A0A7J7N7U5_9MAGN|nr:hypothetical protein GIB67_025079 [Kingdonia uniflora]